MGTLAIYVDDKSTPRFEIPLNLEDTLALDNGCAFIGFTAATGNETYIYIKYIVDNLQKFLKPRNN